jgi:predicted transcriptional regulator
MTTRPPRILNPVIKKIEKTKTQHLTLPKEVGEALRSATLRDKKIYCYLLKQKGWTLQSMADELGVTREMIRLHVKGADLTDTTVASYLPLPDLPVIVTERVVHEPIKPDSAIVDRLKELQPLAQKVRSSSPNFRVEAEEYTALIAKEVERGVPVYQLAKALGVTYSALLFRLTRYGYKPVGTGKSKAYNAIHEQNRKRG